MIEIDMKELKKKLEKGKHAGSLQYWKGKPLPRPEIPPAITLERRARDEAQQIMQTASCGALFGVYQSLAERYGSLIVLLPVAQQVTNQNIAKVLQSLQLVANNNGKIYCLSWYFGIKAEQAKEELAQLFASDAEKAIRDTREMLVYALHLIQTAQKEMIREQKDYLVGWEQYRKRRGISDETNERHCIAKIKHKATPNSNANFLFIEPTRVYDYVTSAFAKQIADSQSAYKEHQKWTRELLLSQQQADSAGSGGGVSIGI
jgi:hypothetical protein